MSTPYIPPMDIQTIGTDSRGTRVHGVISREAIKNDTLNEASNKFASQRRARAQKSISIGDSIMLGSDGAFYGYGGSWFSKLCELSGQRILRIRNGGIAGNSTTQMLARLTADVLTQKGDIVVIEAVTPNDKPNEITVANQKRNIRSIIEQVLFRGKRAIVCGGPPNNDPAVSARMREITDWLRVYAAAQGLDFFDLFTPVGNVIDGAWNSAFTADGVHPNAAGQDAIAEYNLLRIPEDLRVAPILANFNDATNMLTNGLFDTDANNDGYADSWANSGLVAGGLSLRSDGVGNWQSITSSSTANYLQQTGIVNWNVGDILAFSGEWENIDSTSVSAELRFTGGTPYSQPRAISSRSEIGKTRTFYMEVAVPTGTTAVLARLSPGVGTVKFGRLKLVNLTALGIA